MKKISTLLLAVSVAVAASAVPSPKMTKKVVSLPTETERVVNPNHQLPEKAAWAKKAQRDAKPALLPSYQKAADDKNPIGTVSFNDIVGKNLTYQVAWYDGYNAWYVILVMGKGIMLRPISRWALPTEAKN